MAPRVSTGSDEGSDGGGIACASTTPLQPYQTSATQRPSRIPRQRFESVRTCGGLVCNQGIARSRSDERSYRCGFLAGREIQGGVDQAQMRERLRKVSELPSLS